MTAAEIEALVRRYAEGPAVLRVSWSKVPAAARQWRPAPGKWSAHEVVVHVADSETMACGRLRMLLAEKAPVLVGYDQDVWARELDYHAQPAELALATVEAVHAGTVPLLSRLRPETLSRTGRHTEYGDFSVERWLRYYGDHCDVHARQIDRNVAAFAARS